MNDSRARVFLLLLIAGALLFLDCATMGGRGRGGGDFDALGFPGDDTVLTASVQPIAAGDDTDEPGAVEDSEVVTTDVTRPVLRVQFFATTSLSEAEEMKRRATESLAKTVSIDFETPYYKLTVGPLRDEDEAERLVVRLRAMGYESAWIVRAHAKPRARNQ